MSKRPFRHAPGHVRKWMRMHHPEAAVEAGDDEFEDVTGDEGRAHSRGRRGGGVDQETVDTDDTAMALNGDGAGGGHAGGAAGNPLPLLRNQNQRSIDHYRLKFGGTTWIRPANNGTANNVWCNFPWEFYPLFIQQEQIQELLMRWMYWKADRIKIEFKNPLCVQNIGDSTSGLAASGTNIQAQLYAYADNMYMIAPGSSTPENNILADLSNLVDSWDTSGYIGGTPIFLPSSTVSQNNFTSGTPDVKSLGMGGGQMEAFSWNIHSPYWRSTTNFHDATVSGAAETYMPRWDEWHGRIGIVAESGSTVQAPTASRYTQPTSNGGNVSQAYMCPDPIPGLWLQVQPQLASLSTGVGDSACQVNFEMEVDLSLTGRVPRQVSQIAFNNQAAGGLFFGSSMVRSSARPLFYATLNTL